METLKVKPVLINHKEIIVLISEDSVIEKDNFVFRTDTLTIHEVACVSTGFVNITGCDVDKNLCKKVIATQCELSPQLIIRLIDEYNNTGKMNDIVIGIDTLWYGIPIFTNNYITVVE